MNNLPLPQNQAEIISAMKECPQNQFQTVLQHGEAVWKTLQELIAVIHGTSIPNGWRVPEWALNTHLLEELAGSSVLEEYTVYHDCGKPWCKTVDEQGRVHFPDHARVSEQIWLMGGGNSEAAGLMAMDMDAHLLRAENIEEFAGRPQAITLLLTALAEVHANAPMFGGYASDSFKIKCKHLDKKGKQVIQARANLKPEELTK